MVEADNKLNKSDRQIINYMLYHPGDRLNARELHELEGVDISHPTALERCDLLRKSGILAYTSMKNKLHARKVRHYSIPERMSAFIGIASNFLGTKDQFFFLNSPYAQLMLEKKEVSLLLLMNALVCTEKRYPNKIDFEDMEEFVTGYVRLVDNAKDSSEIPGAIDTLVDGIIADIGPNRLKKLKEKYPELTSSILESKASSEKVDEIIRSRYQADISRLIFIIAILDKVEIPTLLDFCSRTLAMSPSALSFVLSQDSSMIFRPPGKDSGQGSIESKYSVDFSKELRSPNPDLSVLHPFPEHLYHLMVSDYLLNRDDYANREDELRDIKRVFLGKE